MLSEDQLYKSFSNYVKKSEKEIDEITFNNVFYLAQDTKNIISMWNKYKQITNELLYVLSFRTMAAISSVFDTCSTFQFSLATFQVLHSPVRISLWWLPCQATQA